MNLSKVYDHKKVESKIYRLWEKSGHFNPDKLPDKRKKTFTIVIPPPNITGSLHMGHALNLTSQDILIRWQRLQGLKTLWLPGTDHAGIATQNVVEKELKKEGVSRFDLGREKFLERVWQWREKYGNIILKQFKKLGSSLDWSRTKFTMDKDYSLAVRTAFLDYYKKGWIYQAERVINWCPRCGTSLSDLEIEHEQRKNPLYFIKYGPVELATVRLETKFGDTAVAVNPADKRYQKYIGKEIDIETILGPAKIKVIADKAVDPEFGTGAVKVTPAHDSVDFEIWQRHKSEIPPPKQVIDKFGKLNKLTGPYQGMKVEEGRKKLAQDMAKAGLLDPKKTDHNYQHNIAICYRCGATIEPMISRQWFLKMADLAKTAIKAVKSGKVKFHPKRWEKIYFDWLKNIKDWCISRQIWWGHKIPLEGVDDVLDTWFSSALWPFAALGWPKKTKDLKNFYPTDILSTDRGIINLWVARMIFSGLEFMKKPPFRDIYVHATVLTREGKRMSKSLGTGVDPLNLIEKYGADATRFGIAYQIMGGQDIRFVEDNIVMGRKFCNKIWNASRFALMQNAKRPAAAQIRYGAGKMQSRNLKFKIKNLTLADKRILKALDKTIRAVNKNLEEFRFGQAAHMLYDFFWHDFCDTYIERAKKQLSEKKCIRINNQTQKVLIYILLNSLKLLHPFMPFITEEIYQKLPIKDKKKCLMIEDWPSSPASAKASAIEEWPSSPASAKASAIEEWPK